MFKRNIALPEFLQQKARELLANETLSISEIAYQVGFKTPVYFSQVFKETFGEWA